MKVNTSYTIDEELIIKLKRIAQKERRSESWMVNEIIKKFFERRKNYV